jgi:AcrR family transcriptional regulator
MSAKGRRKRVSPIIRRREILQAAMQIFAKKGFTAATIPEIAALAEVAAGTIYLYYPNKRELFVAVVENMITVPLKKIFDREGNSDFITILKSAFQDRVNMLQSEHIAGFVSLMGEIQRDPELKKMYLEKLVRPFMDGIEAYFRQPFIQKEINLIEPAILVRAIGGVIIGQIMLKALEGPSSPLNRIPAEKVTEQLVRFVLYGVKGKPE